MKTDIQKMKLNLKNLKILKKEKKNKKFYISGNLDLVSNKAVFRMEFNPWVTPIGDQLQVGISHVMDYIRSETYRQ